MREFLPSTSHRRSVYSLWFAASVPSSLVQIGWALGDDPVTQEGGHSLQSLSGPFLLGTVVLFIRFCLWFLDEAFCYGSVVTILLIPPSMLDWPVHTWLSINNSIWKCFYVQVLFGFILAFATGASPAWDFLALDWRKYISQKSSMKASRLCLKAWSYTTSSTSLSTWFQLSVSFAVKSVYLISYVNFSGFCSLLTETPFLFQDVSPHAFIFCCHLQTPSTILFDHRYYQTFCWQVFSSAV